MNLTINSFKNNSPNFGMVHIKVSVPDEESALRQLSKVIADFPIGKNGNERYCPPELELPGEQFKVWKLLGLPKHDQDMAQTLIGKGFEAWY